jgi:hypothetical protein
MSVKATPNPFHYGLSRKGAAEVTRVKGIGDSLLPLSK